MKSVLIIASIALVSAAACAGSTSNNNASPQPAPDVQAPGPIASDDPSTDPSGPIALPSPLPSPAPTPALDPSLIGEATYGGTGCRAGDAPKLESIDDSLAISFNSLAVDRTDSPIARAACSVAIPIHVPAGKKLSVSGPVLLGQAAVRGSDKVQIATEVFFAGTQGPTSSTELTARTHDDGPFVAAPDMSDWLESQCGADVILRTNSSVLVTGRRQLLQSSQAELETLSFNVKVEDCDQ